MSKSTRKVLHKAASQAFSFLTGPDQSKDDIPENILAFRTITTLLEEIQRKPFKLVTEDAVSSDRNLRLSTAFSTLAVINHEVVAVVAKQTEDNLEVVACAHVSPDQNQQVSQISPSNIFTSFLFTKNFRRDEKVMIAENEETNVPVIKDTEKPHDLESGYEALRQYSEKCRFKSPTFPEHLHILKQLLSMPPGDDEHVSHTKVVADHLLRYVIATSYQKMKRRLDHKTLSQPYIVSLNKVTSVSFDERLQKLSDKEENAIENDQPFITELHRFSGNVNFAKLYPKIAYQVKLAHASEPFQLYSKDTYWEFHKLLLAFLDNFETSLTKLPTCGTPDTFKTHLEKVLLHGAALQKLSKSLSLRIHLQVIESKLQDYHDHHSRPTSMPALASQEAGQDGEHIKDEELEAVQPSVTTANGAKVPLWKSYRNWLKLIVVHFDAVDILVRHLTGSFSKSISLKILVAPHVDTAFLPWRQLINSSYFPTTSEQNAFVTNDQILKFLEDVISMDPRGVAKSIKRSWDELRKQLAKVQPEQELDKEEQGKQLDKYLPKFKSYALPLVRKFDTGNFPGGSDCVAKLTGLLTTLNRENLSPLVDITNEINSLFDSTKFFADVEAINKNKFRGTVHCEACLASLLSHESKEIERLGNKEFESTLMEMKDFGRVIGVSKLCCPTCQYLLHLLRKDKAPFVVRGSHHTVTACSLPTWLPGSVVDKMNEQFGHQLRSQIIDLMGSTNVLSRDRSQSTGSERISSDSIQRPGDAPSASEANYDEEAFHNSRSELL